VCPDLPGHGYSDPYLSSSYHLVDYTRDIVRIADYLGWDKFSLVGHSMGGSISILIAGALPHRVKRLVLIDILGPFTSSSYESPQNFRNFIEWKPPVIKGLYPSLEDAAQKRSKANVVGELDIISARILASRGCNGDDKNVSWNHDPWVKQPSAFRFTENAIRAFVKNIQCPVLVVCAQNGVYNTPLFGLFGRLQDYLPRVVLSLLLCTVRFFLYIIVKILWWFSRINVIEKIRKGVKYVMNVVGRLQLFNGLKNSKIVIFKDGGHHVHMTQPDNIAALFTDINRL
jgi:pimeloyl-ACP methyl ester carboxylesterase